MELGETEVGYKERIKKKDSGEEAFDLVALRSLRYTHPSLVFLSQNPSSTSNPSFQVCIS